MIKKTLKGTQIIILLFMLVVTRTTPLLTENKTKNTSINSTVNLNTMALYVKSIDENRLFSVLDTYSGDLTGYVYNCPLCTGRLACMSKLDLSNGLTTYYDKDYGEVRIIAASKNLKCGSIIRFDSKRVSDAPVVGIVLDRGMLGSDIDILVEDIDVAIKNIGRSFVTYDVLRSGY